MTTFETLRYEVTGGLARLTLATRLAVAVLRLLALGDGALIVGALPGLVALHEVLDLLGEGGVLRLTPLQPLVLGGGVLFCFLLFFLPLPYLPDPLLSGFLALTIVLSDFL